MSVWLAKGENLENIGSALTTLNPSPIPKPAIDSRRILGTTHCVDSFGNLNTNIKQDHWDQSNSQRPIVRLPDIGISAAWVATYGPTSPNQCVSLIGPSGGLEVSIVRGNAAKLFQTHTTAVELNW
jgi:S-adenosylmethionine hydrolase